MWRTRLGSALVAIGAVLLVTVLAAVVTSAVTRARMLERLSQWRHDAPAGEDAAEPDASPTGIVGRIESRRIALDAPVLEGTGAVELVAGVGHAPASPQPGEPGNVVLAGHRDTHFRPLRLLRAGDRIDLTTARGRFDYRVDSILVVDPDRAEFMGDCGDDRLTLITCYPFNWIGPAPHRMVVIAHPLAGPSAGVALGARGSAETTR